MLEIISITPTPDANGFKTADVVSSWGNLPVRYRFGEEDGGVCMHEMHADLSVLTPPADVYARAAGPKWISEVAKAILASV